MRSLPSAAATGPSMKPPSVMLPTNAATRPSETEFRRKKIMSILFQTRSAATTRDDHKSKTEF